MAVAESGRAMVAVPPLKARRTLFRPPSNASGSRWQKSGSRLRIYRRLLRTIPSKGSKSHREAQIRSGFLPLPSPGAGALDSKHR